MKKQIIEKRIKMLKFSSKNKRTGFEFISFRDYTKRKTCVSTIW